MQSFAQDRIDDTDHSSPFRRVLDKLLHQNRECWPGKDTAGVDQRLAGDACDQYDQE